jgi:hypothetical protein
MSGRVSSAVEMTWLDSESWIDSGRDHVMTDTELVPGKPDRGPAARPLVDDQLADELLGRAQAEGVELLGPDGLLSQVTGWTGSTSASSRCTGAGCPPRDIHAHLREMYGVDCFQGRARPPRPVRYRTTLMIRGDTQDECGEQHGAPRPFRDGLLIADDELVAVDNDGDQRKRGQQQHDAAEDWFPHVGAATAVRGSSWETGGQARTGARVTPASGGLASGGLPRRPTTRR